MVRISLVLLVLLIGCGDPEEGGKTPDRKDAATDAETPDGGDAGADDDGDSGKKSMVVEVKCGDMECSAQATCSESSGKPKCECMPGYDGDGKTCKDIDECDKDNGGCDDNADCVNSPGGFDCVCKNGFSGDGASCEGLDECSDEALNTCDPNATCSDTGSGFECECASHFMGDGFGCGDVDECAKPATFKCDDNATCLNTFGGYGCACEPGYDGNGKTCTGLCDSKNCADNVLCQVIDDAAQCSTDTCAVGYVGDGTNCTAIVDADDCDTCDGDGSDDVTGAVCTGMPGDGTCECGPGYSGAASACTDDDECATNNGGCGDEENNRCTNLPGGYFCGCEAGYEKNGSGECVDVDECEADRSPCHPNAKCTNKTPEQNEQGYECKCNDGFEGDGTVCKDINECEDDDDNCLDDGTASCVNTNGGFDCRCNRGYEGDGVKSCKNVDECDDGDLNDCNKNADCTDRTPEQNPKGYECTCKDGYGGDGRDCEDVDECMNAALFECEKDASCFNDVGSYHCGCKSGKNLVESASGSCYCDLSGYWAMRQNLDTCWEAVKDGAITLIRAGKLKSTVWELHKYTYDGETVVTEKKGCNTNKDLVLSGAGPLNGEKYAQYVPDEVYFGLDAVPGMSIPKSVVDEDGDGPEEAGEGDGHIYSGSMFTTPPEAALAGIKLGDDPVNAAWPSDYADIQPADSDEFPRWEDTDGDGEPGFTLWPRLPSAYDYLPLKSAGVSVTRRATCASQALRVVTENVTEVVDCEHMSGTVHNLKSEGHIGSCLAVGSGDFGDAFTCEADDWTDLASGVARCTADEVEVLDGQSTAGQAPNGDNCDGQLAEAEFELVKIGELGDDVGCEEVIEALPAVDPY